MFTKYPCNIDSFYPQCTRLHIVNMASFKSARFQNDPDLIKCLNGELVFKQNQQYSASVETIQRALVELHFMQDVPPSDYGYYGPKTYNAVYEFQKANRLSPDGEVGENTMNALDQAFDTAQPQPGPTPTPVSIPLYYPPSQDIGGIPWWMDLIQFTPPAEVLNDMPRRSLTVQYVENASGDLLNVDFYAVLIKTMPTINGQVVTPETCFETIRSGFTTPDLFLDKHFSVFSPYDPEDDPAWNFFPLKSVLQIRIPILNVADNNLIWDDAAVITSEYSISTTHWRVATVKTPLTRNGNHPVSGIREWGMKQQDGGYIFYTRGADRPTGFPESWAEDRVFAGANSLWLSMQQKVAKFVTDHNGQAEIWTPYTKQFPWSDVVSMYGLTMSRT